MIRRPPRSTQSRSSAASDVYKRQTPRALLSLAGPLVRIPYKMIRTPKEVTDIRRRLEKRVAEGQRMDPENMSYTAYLEWMDKSREYRSPVIALHITASQFAVVFHDFLRKVTERWLDDPHGALASRLVTGLQNIESAQPGVGIWDLSRKVFGFETLERIFTENEPGEILKVLEADPSPDASDFLRSLGTFMETVSYTHLRAHETRHDLVCRLLLEKKKKEKTEIVNIVLEEISKIEKKEKTDGG